ncbi:MAG TPA: hypothetical protein VEG39_09205 [Clostridia bacterium]|nr:hypothetical protein [Clostridia bacterium]
MNGYSIIKIHEMDGSEITWEFIKDCMCSKKILQAKVLRYIRDSYVEVDMVNAVGIIPIEELEYLFGSSYLSSFLNRYISFVIDTFSIDDRIVYCSRKKAQEQCIEQINSKLDSQEVLDARIYMVARPGSKYKFNDGAFVEIDGLLTGYLPDQNFSETGVTVNDIYNVGDMVKVVYKSRTKGNLVFFEAPEKYNVYSKASFESLTPNLLVYGIVSKIVKKIDVHYCFVNIALGIDVLCSIPNDKIIYTGYKVIVKVNSASIESDKPVVRGVIVNDAEAAKMLGIDKEALRKKCDDFNLGKNRKAKDSLDVLGMMQAGDRYSIDSDITNIMGDSRKEKTYILNLFFSNTLDNKAVELCRLAKRLGVIDERQAGSYLGINEEETAALISKLLEHKMLEPVEATNYYMLGRLGPFMLNLKSSLKLSGYKPVNLEVYKPDKLVTIGDCVLHGIDYVYYYQFPVSLKSDNENFGYGFQYQYHIKNGRKLWAIGLLIDNEALSNIDEVLETYKSLTIGPEWTNLDPASCSPPFLLLFAEDEKIAEALKMRELCEYVRVISIDEIRKASSFDAYIKIISNNEYNSGDIELEFADNIYMAPYNTYQDFDHLYSRHNINNVNKFLNNQLAAEICGLLYKLKFSTKMQLAEMLQPTYNSTEVTNCIDLLSKYELVNFFRLRYNEEAAAANIIYCLGSDGERLLDHVSSEFIIKKRHGDYKAETYKIPRYLATSNLYLHLMEHVESFAIDPVFKSDTLSSVPDFIFELPILGENKWLIGEYIEGRYFLDVDKVADKFKRLNDVIHMLYPEESNIFPILMLLCDCDATMYAAARAARSHKLFKQMIFTTNDRIANGISGPSTFLRYDENGGDLLFEDTLRYSRLNSVQNASPERSGHVFDFDDSISLTDTPSNNMSKNAYLNYESSIEAELEKKINEGIITGIDMDLCILLYHCQMATLRQIIDFMELKGASESKDDVFDNLQKLENLDIVNKYQLVSDLTPLTLYTLGSCGCILVNEFTDFKNAKWLSILRGTDYKKIGKSLTTAGFYIKLLDACSGKNLKIYPKAINNRLKPYLAFSVDIKEQPVSFIVDIVRDTDFPINFRYRLQELVGEMKASSRRDSEDPDKKQDMLIVIANRYESMLKAVDLVREFKLIKNVLFTTYSLLDKYHLYSIDTFFKYDQESGIIQKTIAYIFDPKI